MIIIKGRFATYVELWFDESIPTTRVGDVLICRQRSAPIEGHTCTPFHSLVSDLRIGEGELFEQFGKTNRYKISRAQKRDGLDFSFLADPRPALDAFCEFYDSFAQQKSLYAAYRRGLSAACDAKQLVLTSAFKDGSAIVWHAYITCGETAVLLHSASHFRTKDNDERALVGRANRWLHWQAMLGFKRVGFARFDWGGMFADEGTQERAGINNFKREFGGRSELTYNCNLPSTVLGWLYLKGRAAMDRLQRQPPT